MVNDFLGRGELYQKSLMKWQYILLRLFGSTYNEALLLYLISSFLGKAFKKVMEFQFQSAIVDYLDPLQLEFRPGLR